MAKMSFRVTVDAPAGVTRADMAWYIQEWVGCGKGSYHPDDPMFDLDQKSVVVYDPHTHRYYKEEGRGRGS